MRKILTIAWTDLQIFAADRGNLVMLIILPIVMTVLLGGAFTNMGGPSRIRVDLLDEDHSPRSQQFIDALRAVNPVLLLCPQDQNENDACGLGDIQTLDRETSVKRVQNSDTNALIVVPVGYAAALENQEAFNLLYYSTANITTGDVVLQAVNAVLQRVNGAVVAARVGVGLGDALGVLDNATGESAFAAKVFEQADSLWASQPLTVAYSETQTSDQSAASGTSGFSQSVPGMATFFVIFSVLGAGMNGLVRERTQWTLQRLAVLPLSRSELLAGKILMHFTVGIIQFAIIFLVGLFVKVNFGHDLFALALIIVVYTFCITALGLLLASIIQNESQANAMANLLGIVMAALGGAWWPLSVAPQFMQTVGHLTPVAWAMDGFQQLLFYNGGLSDVLLPVGVLAAAAVVLFVLGVRTFRYDN